MTTFLGAPLDLVLYLLSIQAVPLVWSIRNGAENADIRYALCLQVLFLLIFWLVWGGYSVDAWRYLSRFDRDPLRFEEEQLFWVIGHGLGRVLADPWPFKVLSALAAGLFAYATARFLIHRNNNSSYYALFLIPLLPAFFLTFGNAIRQGFAASVVTLGLLALRNGRLALFAVVASTAFLLHQTSILFVLALLLGRHLQRGVPAALLLAPLMSFVADQWATMYDVNLASYIRYADYQEGAFHWVKFIVAYILAWAFWWIRDRDDAEMAWLTASYGYMVALSSILLRYEVPFERLLLYSEFLLPILVISLWSRHRILTNNFSYIWACGAFFGLALWTHPSIVSTLGY